MSEHPSPKKQKTSHNLEKRLDFDLENKGPNLLGPESGGDLYVSRDELAKREEDTVMKQFFSLFI